MKKRIFPTSLIILCVIAFACTSHEEEDFAVNSKMMETGGLLQYAKSKNVNLNLTEAYVPYGTYKKLKEAINGLASVGFSTDVSPEKGFPRKRSSAESSSDTYISVHGGHKTVPVEIVNHKGKATASWSFYKPSKDDGNADNGSTVKPQGSASLSVGLNQPNPDISCTPEGEMSKNVTANSASASQRYLITVIVRVYDGYTGMTANTYTITSTKTLSLSASQSSATLTFS